jgi:hypothetical protein
VFEVSGISETVRQLMHVGYSITVDPGGTIVESDRTNNTHQVPVGGRVRINWQSIRAPYRFRTRVEYHFDAYLVSGEARRQVADWSALQDIPWDTCDMADTTCSRLFGLGHETPRIDVFGDESLEIVVTATEIETDSFEGDRTYTLVYTAEDDWGAGPADTSFGCQHIVSGDPNFYRIDFAMYEGSYRNASGNWVFYEEPWRLTYHICY